MAAYATPPPGPSQSYSPSMSASSSAAPKGPPPPFNLSGLNDSFHSLSLPSHTVLGPSTSLFSPHSPLQASPTTLPPYTPATPNQGLGSSLLSYSAVPPSQGVFNALPPSAVAASPSHGLSLSYAQPLSQTSATPSNASGATYPLPEIFRGSTATLGQTGMPNNPH
jgi:hypothetical protein